MKRLDFDALRAANVARCEETFHPLDDWSLTDWACAAAGEMGEVCDQVKKIRRIGVGAEMFLGVPGSTVQAMVPGLADEIADTVIYLDLLAARAGIDLGEAVRAKFNAVSSRYGSDVRLPDGSLRGAP